MHPDLIIAHLASARHGIVSRSALYGAGLSPTQIAGRLSTGVLVRVQPGVFRVAAAPVSPEQHLAAACVAGGPLARASHVSGAWLRDLCDAPPRHHVTVPRSGGGRPQGVVLHFATRTPRPRAVWGLPASAPVELCVELASMWPRHRVEEAIETMIRRRQLTIDSLARYRDEVGRRGRAGTAVLRRILDDRDPARPPLDSVLEARFLRLVRRAGLPTPVVHPTVTVGALRVVPDFGFPEHRVLVELDGFEHHGGRRAFERDRDRDARLHAAGWLVMRFTWRQVERRPAEVSDVMRRVLAERARTIRVGNA